MRSLPLLLLLLAACLPCARATATLQAEDPPAPPSVPELLRAARDPRRALEERVASMESLLVLGPDAAWSLAQQIEREAARLRRDYEAGLPRLLRAFERGAQKLSLQRQGREALGEIEEARKRILQGARDGALSSEYVAQVSSPALARLEELLLLDANDVFDAEPERFDELAILLDSLLEQAHLVALWRRAHAALLEVGSTSRARTLREPHDPEGEEDGLHTELAFLALLALPMGGRDADVLRANRALARDASLGITAEEAAGIERLNTIRILCGVPALAIDPRLCDASRDHSKDMFELGFFSHTSPLKGKETPGQRAANFGTSGGAENIAAGQSTGPSAIAAWWSSPGHHRNQLAGHSRIGLGRWESLWTQMFG